jgi:hypothetical protein
MMNTVLIVVPPTDGVTTGIVTPVSGVVVGLVSFDGLAVFVGLLWIEIGAGEVGVLTLGLNGIGDWVGEALTQLISKDVNITRTIDLLDDPIIFDDRYIMFYEIPFLIFSADEYNPFDIEE